MPCAPRGMRGALVASSAGASGSSYGWMWRSALSAAGDPFTGFPRPFSGISSGLGTTNARGGNCLSLHLPTGDKAVPSPDHVQLTQSGLGSVSGSVLVSVSTRSANRASGHGTAMSRETRMLKSEPRPREIPEIGRRMQNQPGIRLLRTSPGECRK